MPEEVVVVVAGGSRPARAAALDVPPGALVIAADSGLDHAASLGLEVTVAVGDFDSASPEAIARAEASGTRIERHSTEKDQTDLELALDAAVEMSPARVVVLASDGGRLDHLVSALLLLGSDRFQGVELDAQLGKARVHVIRREREFDGEEGELVSLLALHGPAEGVTTDGLAYALRHETLDAGSSRGVSNVFASTRARIEVAHGVLLAIRPGENA